MEASGPDPGDDLGAPVAYTALPEGVPAFASGGERVGTVRKVLSDEATTIFDGIVLDTDDGERFVDAPEVDRLHEQGITLRIDVAEVAKLGEPTPSPATVHVRADDIAGRGTGGVSRGLRGLWNRLSGRY